MGNVWYSSLIKEDAKVKVWHAVVILVCIWFFIKFLRFLAYRFRIMKNKGHANRMLAERNNKVFTFDPVDPKIAESLLTLDVHGVRQGLLEGKFSSVDLVNFYGQRCYTIGRDLCLTTEEMFDSAAVRAKECDQERKAAIEKGE